ncbi:hypothetical protein BTZ20_4129 [Rhodococcus sp. MTM3W5.2]|nr:hypothetical protein BTZ20_4129 [Rhodococcus sp. MTM3W5.2]
MSEHRSPFSMSSGFVGGSEEPQLALRSMHRGSTALSPVSRVRA